MRTNIEARRAECRGWHSRGGVSWFLGRGSQPLPLQLRGKEKFCKIPGRVSGAEPQPKLKLLHFKGKFRYLVTRVSWSARRKKTDTLGLFPSSIALCRSQKLRVWICIFVSGSSWNFQPGKSPQNRTVRFKTGHLPTLAVTALLVTYVKTYWPNLMHFTKKLIGWHSFLVFFCGWKSMMKAYTWKPRTWERGWSPGSSLRIFGLHNTPSLPSPSLLSTPLPSPPLEVGP